MGIIPLVDLLATLETHCLPTYVSPVQELSVLQMTFFR